MIESIGKKFLMDDFDYKSLTELELSFAFKDIDIGVKIPLMRHQLVSLLFAASRARVAYFHAIGVGKTLAAIATLKLWNCKKTLVVCPSSAFGSWRRDLENYTDFSFTFLTGSTRERKQKLKEEKDVYLIHYEGLKTIYAKLCERKVGKEKKSWGVLPNSFVHNFDCIILDEVHKVKNYDSLQSKICLELSKKAKHLVGLTGTPIDKSFLELFNIFRIIDLGKSLGTNFFAYRYRHFDKEVCGSKWGRKWIEWNLKPDCEEKILDKISDTTLCFSREECFELPPIQEIVRYIHPSKQFLEFQKNIIKNNPLKLPETNILIDKKIKAKAFVLRELPSGFFYYGEDKQVCSLKKNPKVEALTDLLEDSNSKVIIFYWFVEERNIIRKALKKEKISFCSAFGGQDLSDRENEIRRFSEDKDVKVLLSQVTVASEGFDAFVANVVVFFSPLSSPKMRKQCIGRAHRKGQERKVLVVDFVLEDSIEERVIVNRGERFNLVKETMQYIQDFHRSSEETLV